MTDKNVLLICGSTRSGSSNRALLDTAAAIAPSGISTSTFYALGAMPQFNPDDDHDPLPATVTQLRQAIDKADAILVCTPEYAGALPGAMKNLLDWTVGGIETTDKPCGWINSSATGGAGAHAELGIVLGYTGARVVEQACLRLPVGRSQIGADGLISDPGLREAISGVLNCLCNM
jgi:chromate reductase